MEDLLKREERLQNYYTMIREFYYEKNGIKNTIDFLKYMIELLEEENNCIVELINENIGNNVE